MIDGDDERLARAFYRHDRKMIGVADPPDLDRIEADEPRRADARPQAEVARVAAAGAIVEQRFGRFPVEPALAIVPVGALAEQETSLSQPGRKARPAPILFFAACPLHVA